jgi:hypothetical protein
MALLADDDFSDKFICLAALFPLGVALGELIG